MKNILIKMDFLRRNIENMAHLNRDKTQSMLITKNERTGGLDYVITVDNKDMIAIGKAINPYMMYEFGYQATHDINGNKLPIHEQEKLQTHEKAAEEWGKYVENPYIAGAVRFFGEVGQFFYYSVDDLTRLVVTGKHGNYQPYSFQDKAPGGIWDSVTDIQNVMNGARSEFKYYTPKENLKLYNDATFGKE